MKEIKVEIDGTEIIIKTPRGKFVRPLNEKLMEFGPYLWVDTKGHLYREVSSPYFEDEDK